ncbi:hypothetical protein ACA910_021941 [Epithemia clementina (nom. ined.)]
MKRSNNMDSIRKKRLKMVLGSNPPSWVWRDSYAALHPPADPLSLASADDDVGEQEEEQTFRQFMEMGKREPNERGTGRWKIEPNRRWTIAILPMDVGVSTELVQQLQVYLRAFFHGLPVEIHQQAFQVDICNGKLVCPRAIMSSKKKRQTTRQLFPLRHCWIDGEEHLEVFSLFDVMVPYFVLDHHYCVMGLTSHNLAEEWMDHDNRSENNASSSSSSTTYHSTPVLGRACGDRVCVVSVNNNDGDQAAGSKTSRRNAAAAVAVAVAANANATNAGIHATLLATCTHEILHCFGLDHCTSFACVMNAQSSMAQEEECLFLSPLNLKKWVHGVVALLFQQQPQQSSPPPPAAETTTNSTTSVQRKTPSSWSTAAAQSYVVERYRAMKDALVKLHLPGKQKQDAIHWLNQKMHTMLQNEDETSTKAGMDWSNPRTNAKKRKSRW